MLKTTTVPDRARRIAMAPCALSLPPDILNLVERRAGLVFKDRAEYLRELVIGALVAKGHLKVKSDDGPEDAVTAPAELFEAEYPDPAPPKQYKGDFWLYETLNDEELDHLRCELSEGEPTPGHPTL